MIKTHKYKVAPKADRTYGGIIFDSKGELLRYLELLQLERAGHLYELQRQVAFEVVDGVRWAGKILKPIRYLADFTYREPGNVKLVVEDWKGVITDAYRIKRQLLLTLYPEHEFRETRPKHDDDWFKNKGWLKKQ
jgi:hypothetical protein